MTRAWIFVVAACGSTAETTTGPGSELPAAEHTSTATPGGPSSASALAAGDPAAEVVERAFGKSRPAFPLLSKDGTHAAVEVVTPVRRSGGSTYAVGFVTAGADAWSGGEIDLTTVVDGRLLDLVVEARETGTRATYDVEAVNARAKDVTTRLSDEGFRPFDAMIQVTGGGEQALGSFRFTISTEPTGAIAIAVSEGGKPIKTEQLEPINLGLIAEVECVARPRVSRAFGDAGRRRLLIQVGWNVPAQCASPDDKFRLFAST